MELEIITNPKVTGDGQAVIQVPILSRNLFDIPLTTSSQLETAAGAAIKHFKGTTFCTIICLTVDNQKRQATASTSLVVDSCL